MKEKDLAQILGIKKEHLKILKLSSDFEYLSNIQNANDINKLPFINILEFLEFKLPVFDWDKWKKNFKEKANRAIAAESDFTTGVNEKEIKRNRGIQNLRFLLENKTIFKNVKDSPNLCAHERHVLNAWDLVKKDPAKQSAMLEPIIIKTHEVLDIPGKLTRLNKKVNQCYVSEEGNLILGTQGRKDTIDSKTLDFSFVAPDNKTYLIAHKQRSSDGGGQKEAAIEAAIISRYNCKDYVMCCIFEGKDNSNYKAAKIHEHDYFKVFNSWTSFYKYVLKGE